MDCIPDLRTVSGTWTAQGGRNAAGERIALSAVTLQVSVHDVVTINRNVVVKVST